MSKQHKRTRKKNSNFTLFLAVFIVSLAGLIAFIFCSDIKTYLGKNYSENLIIQDAENYNNSEIKSDKNINKFDKNNQDKYSDKDKEYLEKIIKEH
jgi:cytoskeletal protein RodZ